MLTPAGLAGGTESYERQSQVSSLVVLWSGVELVMMVVMIVMVLMFSRPS